MELTPKRKDMAMPVEGIRKKGRSICDNATNAGDEMRRGSTQA